MTWNLDDKPCAIEPLSNLAPVERPWLWEPYLPRGSLVVLDGDPGVGKTFVAMDLAARLSRGDSWPDGRPVPFVRSTGFFANLHDETFLRPRAGAAGAVLDRILLMGHSPKNATSVPKNPANLYGLLYRNDIGLVVVDPLPIVLAAALGSYAPSVWTALDPLTVAAAQTEAVVLLIRHRTKLGRGPALARGLGGISLAGAARSALLVTCHPDDPDLRLLVHTKSNFGPLGPTLGFRIVDGAVKWEGPVDVSAEEIGVLPEAERVRRPRERAAEWLKAELANGPRKAADLFAAAAKRGIPERTVRRETGEE